jgi:hypothetical protein
LYLLDSQSLTPMFQTEPLSNVWGGLSSWQDDDGRRWVLAPVWGPAGAIVAYKVEESNGKPALTQAWVSRNMSSPEPPVITNGVVFALSAGESTHATLYALDAATGKEMYSTGDQVTAPGNLTGITLANGRVYFNNQRRHALRFRNLPRAVAYNSEIEFHRQLDQSREVLLAFGQDTECRFGHATGKRVSRNTHAPLTLPGMLSTAGHCDQSSAGICLGPLVFRIALALLRAAPFTHSSRGPPRDH